MRGLLLAVAAMYAIQGCLYGLSDNTIPQLLNRNQTSLAASETLAIVRLPSALKVFFAPLADYGAQKIPGGYKNLVISLQILMVAAILSLIPLLPEVLQLGGRPGAEKLRWSLFWVAISNAISDLCLDAFALRQMPAERQHLPAVCQVLGIFLGMTAAKSGLFFLMTLELLPLEGLLQGFVALLAIVALLAVLAVALTARPDADARARVGGDGGFGAVLRNSWAFTTRRPNMPHWLLYQLFMPAVNFHHGVVLPSRYEQFGFSGEDYAAYDLPVAVVTVGVLLWASRAVEDATKPLSYVIVGYLLEATVVSALLLQYWSWKGTLTAGFKFAYVALNKLHDLLFFVCDMLEFAFMGRVASLEPQLVATLMTLQASAFNFSEFLYSWLAPTLVDHFSTCSREHDAFSCDFDAYPLVGVGLTLVTLIFLMTQWKQIQAYQDVSVCHGWQLQNSLVRHKLTVGMVLGGISLFTLKEVMLMQ